MTSSAVLETTPSSSFSSFLSWILFGSKIVGGLLLSITALIYWNQNHLVYMPNPPGIPKTPQENPKGYSAPSDWTMSGTYKNRRSSDNGSDEPIEYEEKYLLTEDNVKIHTWLLFHPDGAKRPTLIYFHGNAGNMGFRLPNAVDMLNISKMNILMMDYRGYGNSEGTPTERGLQLDAEAVLAYALNHPRLQGSPIVLFGRSLGGAVATYLASKHPNRKEVSAIILENTFLSIQAMGEILLPVLKYIAKYLSNNKWATDELIADITQPIFFISGLRDELVPPEQMDKLFKSAKRSLKKEFFSVKNGSHNDTWEKAGREYYLKLKSFVEDNVLGGEAADLGVDSEVTESIQVAETGDSKTEEQESTRDPLPDVDEQETDDEYVICENTIDAGAAGGAAIPTMTSKFQVK